MERIPLEQAIDILTEQLNSQTKTEKVPLLQSLNRVLAKPIMAPINVPNFNRSAMDGYAVVSEEVKHATHEHPVTLQVIGEHAAGEAEVTTTTQSLSAIRIMTGAYVPEPYDCIIKQEDTNYGEQTVEIYAPGSKYFNYSKIGEDLKQGELVLASHIVIDPIHIGVMASLGIHEVEVLVPLNVGILSTGSELVEPGNPLGRGQIYNSNQSVMLARLATLNVNVTCALHVADDVSLAARFIDSQMANVDLFITTGGVSVGKKDIMHDVLKELEAERLFWRLQMRPGTPVLASRYKEKLILSLSGNPFAALTTFELLVRPLMNKFLQTNHYALQKKQVQLQGEFKKSSPQRRFVRAYCEDQTVRLINQNHASSVLSSMIGCNCFIDLPANSGPVANQETVTVWML